MKAVYFALVVINMATGLTISIYISQSVREKDWPDTAFWSGALLCQLIVTILWLLRFKGQ